jgi:hypothetical protein
LCKFPPASRNAVANEWRNVWTVTRLFNRAFTAARFNAFDSVVSFK